MSFGEKILEYKNDILNDLASLVAIDSVSVEGSEKPRQALEYMLARGTEMGLKAKNVDNIAGHLEYGTGKRLCGVLTHLDVVPAGKGWSVPPFALTQKDGRLYGRGVADDKGSAVVAMYCLKALLDNGINADSTIRLIMGTTEETGMTDVKHYFSKERVPDIGFTPDSDYGICNCEKGILQISVTGKNDSKIIKAATGGSAVNAVPDSCTFTLSQEITVPKNCCGNFTTECKNGITRLTSEGSAAHAMEPYKGFNSITHAVNMLCSLYSGNEIGSMLQFINECIGIKTDGSPMGLNLNDQQSGSLTMNLGVINIDSENAAVKIDLRYPVSACYDSIADTIKSCAEKYGLSVSVDSHLAPLNVPADSRIIAALQQAYKEITGEMPNLYSTGGGTYARSLENKGVAFGPVFSSDCSNMHKPDESLNTENFLLHAQICLEAMYRMFTQ